MNTRYRPWGNLERFWSRLPQGDWSYIGCISTGERSLAGWCFIRGKCKLTAEMHYLIHDVEYPLWQSEQSSRERERIGEYSAAGGVVSDINELDIFSPYEDIIDSTRLFLNRSSNNIFVDISSLPKRYFFPLIKVLYRNSDVNNLLVIYSRPISYDRERPLAINVRDPEFLPLFSGDTRKLAPTRLIISVGYESLGLVQVLTDPVAKSCERVKCLFPFPGDVSGNIRNWETVQVIDNVLTNKGASNIDKLLIERVNAYDLESIYSALRSETSSSFESSLLAPFGPKTISLAMCLFACNSSADSAVIYTQPESYNPMYSHGVRESNVYCLKLGGRSLY